MAFTIPYPIADCNNWFFVFHHKAQKQEVCQSYSSWLQKTWYKYEIVKVQRRLCILPYFSRLIPSGSNCLIYIYLFSDFLVLLPGFCALYSRQKHSNRPQIPTLQSCTMLSYCSNSSGRMAESVVSISGYGLQRSVTSALFSLNIWRLYLIFASIAPLFCNKAVPWQARHTVPFVMYLFQQLQHFKALLLFIKPHIVMPPSPQNIYMNPLSYWRKFLSAYATRYFSRFLSKKKVISRSERNPG